ncbi:MAG: DUF4830 domain-containing protein [Oscillospiraceae bacterium]|nr:DUF4830 domain-containing protein [Oscillospiraceae bacterium]
MFIVTAKLSKKRALVIVLVIAVLLTTVIVLAARRDRNTGIEAETAGDVVTFLETLGWQVDPEPIEVAEVLIPREWGEVYEAYNALQLEAGFDLTPHKGRPAVRHTYRVLNYPGQSDGVVVDVLVADGRVIGGGIQSVYLDGFIHGLFPNVGT